ncbi:SPOR domain-containing protein [Qipengyuania sp. MTN3-11]|uniref:SPOR domain-containing protein n=1 Tax=Qipengyuania sp. MTN3-11 TaxID=3056557 RepID=UPI0036F2FDEC
MTVAREFHTPEGEEGAYDGEEFAFADDDESLPWLEADEDDEPQGFDTTRLIAIAVGMVLVLGAIVGGIWWLSNSGVGGGPEPDGSIVAAPEGPYKTAPENAGGKTFEGTGDTSFAVGEGQTREGRLAERPDQPAETSPPSSSEDEAKPVPARGQSLPDGTAVQVGAYSSRADAEAGWQTITRQTDLLSGVDYRIVEGQADIGRVYRLQAVGGSGENARRLCRALTGAGVPCTVK